MSNHVIKITDVIGCRICSSLEQGEKVRLLITEAINRNEKVCLSFENVTAVMWPFLDSIGELYNYHDHGTLELFLQPSPDIKDHYLEMFDRSMQRARALYELRAKIDYEYTNNVVCPYCGYEDWECWEYTCDAHDDDVGETECLECERKFSYTVHRSITYSTSQ